MFEVEKRLPVWHAMSDLFLDREHGGAKKRLSGTLSIINVIRAQYPNYIRG
ncbi:hypothetical protein [Rhizobium phaseoli]|uniref:hypothetical protein n=1 Tax=Rhizobium phaseoli TaxID=396 RepID=UPI0003149422|nr:hypothetical protein [Rhizobium phaseoli]KKZ85272.1 hypothetical protein RPHASCH2410_PA00730 [Rhizobium phaseoli Ch24-10]